MLKGLSVSNVDILLRVVPIFILKCYMTRPDLKTSTGTHCNKKVPRGKANLSHVHKCVFFSSSYLYYICYIIFRIVDGRMAKQGRGQLLAQSDSKLSQQPDKQLFKAGQPVIKSSFSIQFYFCYVLK